MTKLTLILCLLLCLIPLSNLFSQEFDENLTIDEEIERMDVQDIGEGKTIFYGAFFPQNTTNRSRDLTKDEYIFKTYILEKLLNSNRILY